jgi:phage gp36-like protein
MAYATQSDIVTLYGEASLVVADHDRDGTPDAAAISQALAAASAEIDAHIAVRYGLPLHEVPAHLKQLAVDIALYRLAASGDVLTEELRKRYDDAVKHLMRVAEGKAALVFATPAPVPEPDETGASAGPQPIVVTGPPKVFTRDLMRDL